MAKERPKQTLHQMELQLGYSVKLPKTSEERFFSDLSPVPLSLHNLAEIELRACKNPHDAQDRAFSQLLLPDTGKSQLVDLDPSKIVITRQSDFGCYVFAAEVQYPHVFDLSLLLTGSEVANILHVQKLRPKPTCPVGPIFSRFPKEVREKIFGFAIPYGIWTSQDPENSKCNFPASLGDPSGFYFPLNGLGLLQVNRQIRQEALPIAFQKTFFRMDDLDDLTKLLIAIGDIGRQNLKSLEFTWQGRSHLESDHITNAPNASSLQSTELAMILPTLHVRQFSNLLRQCKRLKLLRVLFDVDGFANIDPADFDAYTGVGQLETVQSIMMVEVCGLDYALRPAHHLSRRLKDKLQSASSI